MSSSKFFLLAAAALFSATALRAQDDAAAADQPSDPPAESVSTSVLPQFGQLLPFMVTRTASYDAPYVALTWAQNYAFSLIKMTGAGALPLLALHAAFDQARASPVQWGGGMDSFGVRMASDFGRSFVRQNVSFLVRAVDHEDPRYFRLGHGSGWTRTKWALRQTFLARNSNGGGWMPAYSRFIANSVVPVAASQWGPAELPPLKGVRSATVTFGVAGGSNVFQEFWPDLKNRLRMHIKNGGQVDRLLNR